MTTPSSFGRKLRQFNAAFWRHKYFWTILLFAIFAGFVDENSYWRYRQLAGENQATLKEIRHYEEIFERDRARLEELRSDPHALLRVAREDHKMKSADEYVYYIVESTVPDTASTPETAS